MKNLKQTIRKCPTKLLNTFISVGDKLPYEVLELIIKELYSRENEIDVINLKDLDEN